MDELDSVTVRVYDAESMRPVDRIDIPEARRAFVEGDLSLAAFEAELDRAAEAVLGQYDLPSYSRR